MTGMQQPDATLGRSERVEGRLLVHDAQRRDLRILTPEGAE
jgi:hypothetical protein